MRAADDIEKLIRKFYAMHKASIAADSRNDERLVGDALRAFEKSQSTAIVNPERKIVKAVAIGRVAKLAAATVVTVALLLATSIILNRAATPAYAIEQTIEAIKKVSVVHIFGRDWRDKHIEMWAEVNPDTGLMEYCRIDYIDDNKEMVSTPQNTYVYDKRINTVRIKDGPSLSSIFRIGEFFEGMKHLSEQLGGRITYCEVFDPSSNHKLLELKMSWPKLEVRSLIDPESKLPISIDVIRGEKFWYDALKNATWIHYDDVPPEGLFDFRIPMGANVVIETIEDPVQKLPANVLQHCAQLHRETLEQAKTEGLPANTQIYLVDNQCDLRVGGFLALHNDANEVWMGEVSVCNFDYPNLAVFDEHGKKQQIRVVQRKQLRPGRFHLYWKLEEPLRPGQRRFGIYWISDPRELHKEPADSRYCLRMNNSYGTEAIENFILIVPAGFQVADSSRKYESHKEIDGCGIYTWQRHLPKHRTSNTVEVSLVAK
jgi:hypothetical protein